MAPHSSTLAWKIPWMEEPGRLQSMGSLRVGSVHDQAPRDRSAEAPAMPPPRPPAKLESSREVPAYLRGARGRDICNLASSHMSLHQRGQSEGPRRPREAPAGDSLPAL